MQWKPWTRQVNCRLPLRYWDVVPEPLLQGPSQSSLSSIDCADTLTSSPTPGSTANIATVPSTFRPVRQFFATQRNNFGLFRTYDTTAPSHDPEEHNTLEDVSMTTIPDIPEHLNELYSPYPNLNAFQLGDWYWNGGAQKSQADFQKLLNIVGDPNFKPDDVRAVSWKDVNHTLASDGAWMDEDVRWEQTPVSISVPFQPHCRTSSDSSSSPKEFKVDGFYHRNFVLVIREKLSNAMDDDLFHYEPYALKWQPGTCSTSVNIYGELYTSQVFIKAHRLLQDMPAKPGCNAPRHVVTLMFYLDSTHLTSFGNSKLWPLYLFFGN